MLILPLCFKYNSLQQVCRCVGISEKFLIMYKINDFGSVHADDKALIPRNNTQSELPF